MGHNFMYLLQLTATVQQQFDDACATATTQATQGPTTQRPATTDDTDTVSEACSYSCFEHTSNQPRQLYSNS